MIQRYELPCGLRRRWQSFETSGVRRDIRGFYATREQAIRIMLALTVDEDEATKAQRKASFLKTSQAQIARWNGKRAVDRERTISSDPQRAREGC